ncbi:MAG: long-chain fatty acid--CoA ligase [Motiliproteus sp.]
MNSTPISALSSTIGTGIAQILHRRASLSPDNKALSFEDQTLTYAQLSDRVKRLAAALQSNGVEAGQVVGFLGMNHGALLETLFAASSIGAIFLPLNFRLTGKEISFIVNDANINTLLVDDALYPTIDPIRADLCCTTYIGVESAMAGDLLYSNLLRQHQPIIECHPTDPDETAVLMYTSGTTGLPKGVMLTHNNLNWSTLNMTIEISFLESDVNLITAPLFHIGGLNVTTLGTFYAGGHVVVMKSFDPVAVLQLIETQRVSTMFGAPTMFQFMAQQPQFATTDLSSVRVFMVGAAPVPKPLLDIYNARDIYLCHAYGLTETAPLVLILGAQYRNSKIGSAGKPPLFTDVRLVDVNNQPVAVGEKGEIVVRGPNVMKGYLNRPDDMKKTIDEQGWFHSGDIAYQDEDGFFYICDRLKDMIISGGENVYPAEVESVFTGHDAIAEVAVIGMSDEKWGEAVTAIVTLHEDKTLTLEELRDYGAKYLARYKLPLHLHIVDQLPRNPAGKLLKFELRKRYSQ